MDKKKLFLWIISIFFLGTERVLAFEVNYSKIPGFSSINSDSTIGEYVCAIFGFAQNLALSIAVLSIVFGGVYYLVSYGRGKFTSEAKEWIKAGISGLLLIICAILIIQTINPEISSCKSGILSAINFLSPNSPPSAAPGVEVVTYKEIPIGVLTENLLTRKINCYGFDQEGNPVNGEKIDGKLSPTYMNHDRADCLTQLADGAQKKSQVIAELSDEIIVLMNQCRCEGKCDPTCGGQCGNPTRCPGGACVGPCVGGSCEQPEGTTDCCPPGVKDMIERGPITMTVDVGSTVGSCTALPKNYSGLDEFRSDYDNNYSTIKNKVEKTVTIKGKQVIIIDSVGNDSPWHKLKLIDQLVYFQGKIEEVKKTIEDDKNVLEEAESTLSKCYLATSYVDLLKIYEGTDQTKKIILTQKAFSDPQTKEKIDASKYCNGYNYANSSCFKKCNDICPDTSNQVINAYKACSDPKNQKTCIEKAYNERPCIYSENPSQTFEKCIDSCQGDCASNCEKKYLKCSDEYNLCKNQCENNSQCVLDNTDKCLLNYDNLYQCAINSDPEDPGNTKFCIKNAYWCKNGSNEYAGYSDCVDTTIPNCSANIYSSSFLYESFSKSKININSPSCEKCSYPYEPAKENTACYSSKNKTATCQEICPETTKCPSSSMCPDCPCDYISDPANTTKPLTLNFSIPATYVLSKAGMQSYDKNSQPVLAYQMVGPQCNEQSYNDDPLTFYCEDNPSWWQPKSLSKKTRVTLGPASIPLGNSYKVELKNKGEIPIGQTVDDAEKWADDIIKPTKLDDDIKELLLQMTKAGEAKDTYPVQDYCKCNAKFETNLPICKTDCQYNSWQVCSEDGNCWWECRCYFKPCAGNPCQQVIDYLSAVWNANRQLKLDFIDLYMAMLLEPRSDIMKKLTYSRQTTNSCSIINNSFESQAIMIDCTRVKDEIIPPVNVGNVIFNNEKINVGCYGQDLGLEVNKTLMDNWFCAKKWK